MSGSYPDAAGPTIAADTATIAAAVSPAVAQTSSGQATAAAFVAAHGAAVNDGHATVGYMPPIIVTGE